MIAYQLAVRLGVPLVEVDDLVKALRAMTRSRTIGPNDPYQRGPLGSGR
jgi:hypothetical protein